MCLCVYYTRKNTQTCVAALRNAADACPPGKPALLHRQTAGPPLHLLNKFWTGFGLDCG